MIDDEFKAELRGEMRTNRAALYDLRQVNRSLVVAVNENVGATHEVRDEVRGLRVEMHEMRVEMRTLLKDMRDILDRNTEALFLILDELRGSGPADATG